MQEFMKYDFTVDQITFACIVKAGTGNTVHKNRRNHGLALFPDGKRIFTFEGKTEITVSKNMIVYFPKGSNYTIDEIEISDCYAINFDLPIAVPFEPFAFKVKNIAEYLEAFKKSDKAWTRKKQAICPK